MHNKLGLYLIVWEISKRYSVTICRFYAHMSISAKLNTNRVEGRTKLQMFRIGRHRTIKLWDTAEIISYQCPNTMTKEETQFL